MYHRETDAGKYLKLSNQKWCNKIIYIKFTI